MRRIGCLLALAAAACGPSNGSTACGISALAGPLSLLEQFGVPRRTLSRAPATLPERVVVRIVAGPTVPAVVGRVDTTIVIGVDGALPAGVTTQFGVLVADPTDKVRGVMLYDTPPVAGAPQIGTVHIGTQSLPLLGVEVDLATVENPRCPFFPDSTLK
jgi:hypothetical protein